MQKTITWKINIQFLTIRKGKLPKNKLLKYAKYIHSPKYLLINYSVPSNVLTVMFLLFYDIYIEKEAKLSLLQMKQS